MGKIFWGGMAGLIALGILYVVFYEQIECYYSMPYCDYFELIEKKCDKKSLIESEVTTGTEEYLLSEVVKYDKYEYHYNVVKKTGERALVFVVVTDPTYKIGIEKIGIGSSMKQVMRKYHRRYILEVSDSKHQIRYAENNAWVEFQFDDAERVVSIKVMNTPH